MLDAFILLLPAFVCMTWAIRLLLIRKNNRSESLRLLFLTAVSGGITFFIDSCLLSPLTDSHTIVILLIALQAALFTMFPCIIGYTLHISGGKVHPTLAFASFLPAVIMTVATAITCAHAGIDAIAGHLDATGPKQMIPARNDPVFAFAFTTTYVHLFILGVWLTVCWGLLLHILISRGTRLKDVLEFLKAKKAESQVSLNCLVILLFIIACSIRIIVGRHILLENVPARWSLEICLGILAAIALKLGTEYGEQQVSMPGVIAESMDKGGDSMDELERRLTAYMEDGEAFLDPHLSLEGAASALNSNRTYLSAVIRDTKGETFRTYVNRLRIEAAKREMMMHPEEGLEAIAARTGFISDTQLVKKFTEVTGKSPRKWSREQK
ncbi:MAG: helix-turn-helix domain-containing protein [Bacteroidales bacterium]|nr:helix-turn-helix domain-containing protein [Bacteroidales bacterium]